MKTSAAEYKSTRYQLSSAELARLITFLGGTPGDAISDPLPIVGGEVAARDCRETGRSSGSWQLNDNISFECSAMNEQFEVNCRTVSQTRPDGKKVFYEQCDVVDRVQPGSRVRVMVITEPSP